MRKLIVVPGLVIGKLTVIREYPRGLDIPEHVPLSYYGQGTLIECQCECGQLAYYPEKFLRSSSVKTCGCGRMKSLLKGSENRKLHDEAQKYRTAIRSLQKEQTKHRVRGTLDFHPEIGEQLRFAFAKLRELGFTR